MKHTFFYIILVICYLIVSCQERKCSDEEIQIKIDNYKNEIQLSPKGAIEIIDSIITFCDFKSADIYADKAYLLEDLNDWKMAINSYTKALELGYDKRVVFYNMANCYSYLGIADSSWNEYEKFRKTFPLDTIRHLTLRFSLNRNLKNNQLALDNLDTLIHYFPEEAFFFNERAYLLLKRRDTIGYCKAINEAIIRGISEQRNISDEELLKICD